MIGTICCSSVLGPTHQRMVPSVRLPAIFNICSPSAATMTNGLSSVINVACCSRDHTSPCRLAVPVSSSESRIARYSDMCLTGRSHFIPQRPSTEGWCARPIPRTSRPLDAACAVSAPAAMTSGWRVHVGTTAVPSSMFDVARPAIASTASESASAV